ncbi:MAG TPA: glycosyltransferase family 2 protein [Gemmataceae bacterium]|jgi:glycosyltransferase involved in cell wall biosynthesis
MLSIVIPLLNENPSLAELHAEIAAAAERSHVEVEMIFVDDGSTDGSWDTIAGLGRQDGRVRGIRLRTNFGKAAALTAGFKAARGELVMTLDADLQDDPAEIPRFLDKIKSGLDVVSGWKQKRHDPWHKVWPSRVFNWMVGALTGVKLHDHNCGMKCYRAEVLREVRLYGELHRFIPVLADARGFRVGEVPVHHRPRPYGRSKYGVRRFVKGFLDLMTVKFLTDFRHRPQHVLGSLGLVSFGIGALGLAYLLLTWLIRTSHPDWFEPLHQRPLLVYSAAALLLGAQLLSIGLLAEMLTAYNLRDEDRYSVADRVGDPPG